MQIMTRAFVYCCSPTVAGSNIQICSLLFMVGFVRVLVTQVCNPSRASNKFCRFETKISSLYMSISWCYQ